MKKTGNQWNKNGEGYTDLTAGMALCRVAKEERRQDMGRKRNCRRTVKENIIISSLGRKDHPAGMQIAVKEAGLAYVSGMNQPPQWTLWLKAVCTGTF